MKVLLDNPTGSRLSSDPEILSLYERLQDRTLDELSVGESVERPIRHGWWGTSSAVGIMQPMTGMVVGTAVPSACVSVAKAMVLVYWGGTPLWREIKGPRRRQITVVDSPAGEVSPNEASDTREVARSMARERPAAEGAAFTPKLSGNVVSDLRAITGLTIKELADICRVSERRLHDWATGDAMSARHETRLLRLLYLFGLLAEALPVSEVRRWLRSPRRELRESPVVALSKGRDEDVAGLIERFVESPAT